MRNSPPDGRLSPTAEVYWREALKKAHAGEGRILCAPGVEAHNHLLRIIGGDPVVTRRYLKGSVREWLGLKLIAITGELATGLVIEVVNWGSYLPHGPDEPFRWRMMVTIDSDRFAMLSSGARGFSHVLQSIAGDSGDVPRLEEDLIQKLGWIDHRRFLKRHGLIAAWVKELVEDDRLGPSDGPSGLGDRHMRIRNFTEMQVPQRAESGGTEPAPSEHRAGTEPVPSDHRDSTDTAPTVYREADKPAESLRTGDADLIGSDLKGLDPPKAPQGGQGELGFEAWGEAPRPAYEPQLRAFNHGRARKRPSRTGDPAGGYSAAFERWWAWWLKDAADRGAMPGVKRKAWDAWLCQLATLPGREQELDTRVTEHIGWASPLQPWREGRTSHHFAVYLNGRTWLNDVRPTNLAAFERKDSRTPRQREEAEQAARVAEANRQTAELAAAQAAEAAIPKPSKEQRIRVAAQQRLDFRRDRYLADVPYAVPGKRPPEDVQRIWDDECVLHLREFWKLHPEVTSAAELPRPLREFLAAHPDHKAASIYTDVGVGAPLPPPAEPRHFATLSWPASASMLATLRLSGQGTSAA